MSAASYAGAAHGFLEAVSIAKTGESALDAAWDWLRGK